MAAEHAAEVATVVQAGALDEPGQVRMEGEMLDRAVEEGLQHHVGASVSPQPAALGDEGEDRRQAPLEHRLVERAFVPEMVVEARLVLEARPRRDLPHRDAGVAPLGEAPLRDVENEFPRRGSVPEPARERARAHLGPLTEQTFVCKECSRAPASGAGSYRSST